MITLTRRSRAGDAADAPPAADDAFSCIEMTIGDPIVVPFRWLRQVFSDESAICAWVEGSGWSTRSGTESLVAFVAIAA